MNTRCESNIQTRHDVPHIAVLNSRFRRNCAGLLASLGFAALVLGSAPAQAQVLGTAGNFGVLAGTAGVTNTGPTVVVGSVGVYPAASITGFPPGSIAPGTGFFHAADAVAQRAQADNTAAFGVLSAGVVNGVPFVNIPANLGGQVLGPGVYRPVAGDFSLTGTLTLTTPGLYVFQTAAGFVSSSGGTSSVNLGGASACDVFWTVPSSAAIGTGSVMAGNILALTSITIGTGASLQGRALAQNGAATLASNAITACVGGSTPGFAVGALGPIPPPLGTVPTLSEWAIVMLAALLAIAGFAAMRRQVR